MREDGFYWTEGGGSGVVVRELSEGNWYTPGDSWPEVGANYTIISDRLMPPPEAKPKSGMTDAERALLLAVGQWACVAWSRDEFIGMLAAVESEGK